MAPSAHSGALAEQVPMNPSTQAVAALGAGECGQRGKEVRSDCWIRVEIRSQGGVQVQLKSTVEAYYGDSIRALVQEGAKVFGISHAAIEVEDGGALPFVLMARMEVACRRAIPGLQTRWVPPGSAPSRTSRRDRFRRSRLYLPGNEPKYMLNAGLHEPDAIILDLEDSVAAAEKDSARVLVRNALAAVDFGAAERMVRINPEELGRLDIAGIFPAEVDLVLLPKVESAEQVRAADKLLRELSNREVFLMPIIESARGVLHALEIAAASPRNVALTIGLEDYTADIGTRRSAEGKESLWARSMIVNAAKACGLQAIDSVFSDVGDEEGLRASVREAKALGFEGKGCIHPRQIRPIHEAFAPSAEELERAQAIVRAFAAARERGLGVVSLGTKMIDAPVVKRAEQTVKLAVQAGLLSADWESSGRSEA